MTENGNNHALLWKIVGISLFVRLIFAIFTPLGVDESYAIAVAREFSWAFFDHPPLGFWAPVFAAELTGVEHPLVYRAPTLMLGTLTTLFLYAIGAELGGQRAGQWGAILFAVAPAFVLTGVFVLPDGPLYMGSTFAVLWLVRITKFEGQAPFGYWLLAGAGLAVALASKYQAGLIPISALVFAGFSPAGRRWFKSPGLYLASLIGLLGLVPVLLWNVENDWASFTFHSARTGDGLNLANFAKMAVGQGLYLLPPVLVLALIGIKKSITKTNTELLLVALIALGPIVSFNIIYLFSNSSFPHWTMPGWLFALPLAGVWLARTAPSVQKRARYWLTWFTVPVFSLLLIAVLHLNTGVLTRFTHDDPPNWDRTVESFNFSVLQGKLEARGDLDGIDMIAARSWIEAGAISSAMQGEWPVRVLGENQHHFAYMSSQMQTGTALLLDYDTVPNAAKNLKRLRRIARKIDPAAENLGPVILNRGSNPYLVVNVIRLTIPAP